MNKWYLLGDISVKEGGDALMHVYVWEHIVSLYYRTAW